MVALKQAIQEGIDSGIATDFDPVNQLEELKANRALNG
jgi:antitoxin ParD1/3/4